MGKITGLSTKDMSREDWLKQREHGIGGSDVASILGLDKYKPALKLFHQKTGLWETDETDNIAMYAGRISEEHIYNHYWRFWDSKTSDPLDMLANATASLVQRTASRRDEIITNSDYPHLKANIDYEIDDHEGRKAILELKTGREQYWSQWESGMPIGYIYQVQHYMMVTGYDYSEIFGLLDGRTPKIFEIPESKAIQSQIGERTADFWQQVKEAKKIIKEQIPMNEKLALIAEFEPTSEPTDGFEEYIKERYKTLDASKSKVSNDEIEDARLNYRLAHEEIGSSEKVKKANGNMIRDYMVKEQLNEIIMEDGQHIKWFNNRLTIPKLKK